MENERFERLMEEARNSNSVKSFYADAVLGLVARETAQRKHRQVLLLLEAGCTPEQWAKVLAAIEQNWP